jgi:hypothetical protein
MSGVSSQQAPWRVAEGWQALSLAALGISAVTAVWLVAARLPWFEVGVHGFRTALVVHVALAVLVWLLAAAAGRWTEAAKGDGRAQRLALGVAAAGVCAMVAAPAFGGMPILSNYVPLLDNRLFLGGLALFLAAVAVSAGLAMPRLLRHGWGDGGAALALALGYWLALLTPALEALRLRGTSRLLPWSADERLWGLGHQLQLVYILLLLLIARSAGARLLGHTVFYARGFGFLTALVLAVLCAGVVAGWVLPSGSPEHRLAFTELMRWGAWPAAALLALGLLVGARRQQGRLDDSERALFLPLALFAVGGLLGAMIGQNATTLVPAHYHGTVGAITFAVLLGYAADPQACWQEQASRLRRWAALYGLGTLLLVCGLALAGVDGAPRKVTFAEWDDGGARSLALLLIGAGGTLAVLAAAAFALTALRRLGARFLACLPSGAPVRWRAAAMVAALIAGGGALLEAGTSGVRWGGDGGYLHAGEQKHDEILARFNQGVLMLHAKQYEHALTAFHRVLELAPEMPEAYVNLGFTLLGLERHAAAHDFFVAAIALRKDQLNAYYGLAAALEPLGDLEGARGAMRTYLHLAPQDDPHRRRAEAALWEWSSRAAAEHGEGDDAGRNEPAS